MSQYDYVVSELDYMTAQIEEQQRLRTSKLKRMLRNIK